MSQDLSKFMNAIENNYTVAIEKENYEYEHFGFRTIREAAKFAAQQTQWYTLRPGHGNKIHNHAACVTSMELDRPHWISGEHNLRLYNSFKKAISRHSRMKNVGGY